MLNGLFNIGQSALNANQAWISVTGNNLANVETEGYSRQYVDQKDAGGLTYRPGAQPLGVNAQQIMRFFDQFLERSYVRQSTNSSRWNQQDTIMASLENIFNESNRQGVNSALNNFFNAWQDLALRPESTANRESLLSFSDSLSTMFTNTSNAIKAIQDDMNVSIRADVNRVNEIAKSIADLNNQITSSTIEGMNNPNALLDKRDQLVRELSTLVDVETIDHGKGNFRVQLTTGQPLVDGNESYSLAVLAAQKENHLLAGSPYKGTVNFDGTSTHEYTIEIVKPGATGSAGPYKPDTVGDMPSFRVSLDGGKTWLKGEDGKEMHYPITTSGELDADGNPKTDDVLVKDLRISFTDAVNFTAGDRFVITPKEGLYWIEPTRGPQNITPQIGFDGQDNPNRVTGGKLAAYFAIRDDNCGRYQDELNAVANTLIWEVNRIHSQGAGLVKLDVAQGNQYVGREDAPLGSDQAMTAFAHKMQEGNVNFHFYDKTTGQHIDSTMLDFGNGANFDPSKHRLEDVVDAINGMSYKDANGNTVKDADGNPVSPLKASIQNGKLFIESADDNIQFAIGADTAGLMAGLGINSFFAGTNATNIAVDSQIHINTNLIAAGAVNGQFEVNAGDNITATTIGKLVDKTVKVTTMWKTVENQTIGQYYANLVTTVGADRRTSKTNTEYHTALTNDLFERTQAVSGVNMDEEMSNLIKYQHSYTAAAKLITTADQMLQTLLGLKQ